MLLTQAPNPVITMLDGGLLQPCLGHTSRSLSHSTSSKRLRDEASSLPINEEPVCSLQLQSGLCDVNASLLFDANSMQSFASLYTPLDSPCSSSSGPVPSDHDNQPPGTCPYFAVQAEVGRRPYMEDCHCMVPNLPTLSSSRTVNESTHFFGIFDGHGGSHVSSYCARNFANIVAANLDRQLPCSLMTEQEAVQHALHQSFADVDAALRNASEADMQGGSTALVSLVNDRYIWVGHCGDSRAVLARRDACVALTLDHKPEDPSETDRITKAGGRVLWNAGARVMGVLAMSRAIGDFSLQPFGVIPDPEVVCLPRQDDDEFMILASDGLWNVVNNEEAVSIARLCIERAHRKGADRRAAARVVTKVLIKAATQRGSTDNITVAFIDLQRPVESAKKPCLRRETPAVVPEYRRCTSMPSTVVTTGFPQYLQPSRFGPAQSEAHVPLVGTLSASFHRLYDKDGDAMHRPVSS